nr:MAG TPA: hypothetical protein [Caudoviricetes sp.]
MSKFKQHKILQSSYLKPQKQQVTNRKYLLMRLVKIFSSKVLLQQWAATILLPILIDMEVEQNIYGLPKKMLISAHRLKVFKSY